MDIKKHGEIIMKALPKIKAIGLENSKTHDDPLVYLHHFAYEYNEMIKIDPEIINSFQYPQYTLWIFCHFHREVTNGGFIQLIYNGYGPYVFDTPHISDILDFWGAIKTAEIIDKVKIIYNKHRIELERKFNIDDENDFAKVYTEFSMEMMKKFDFLSLQLEYYQICEDEIKIIKKYVENNINEFGIII
jgi:hypothetical protein